MWKLLQIDKRDFTVILRLKIGKSVYSTGSHTTIHLCHLQVQFSCTSVPCVASCLLMTLMTADLEEKLVETDDQISRQDSQLAYWKQFRDKGLHENDKTIHLLEQELIDMEASFTEISSTTRVFVHLLN